MQADPMSGWVGKVNIINPAGGTPYGLLGTPFGICYGISVTLLLFLLLLLLTLQLLLLPKLVLLTVTALL